MAISRMIKRSKHWSQLWPLKVNYKGFPISKPYITNAIPKT